MNKVLYLPESVLEAWEAAEPSYFIKKQNIMKWGIICLKDGKASLAIPIMDSDDDSCMATWNSLEEAKDFAAEHILCQISAVLYIDLENGLIDF